MAVPNPFALLRADEETRADDALVPGTPPPAVARTSPQELGNPFAIFSPPQQIEGEEPAASGPLAALPASQNPFAIFAPEPAQEPLEEQSSFGRGLDAGVLQARALGQAAAGTVGQLVGADDFAQNRYSAYQELMDEASAIPQTSFAEARESLPGFLSWAAGALGSNVPMIASVLATGGIGGLVGRLVAGGAVKKAAADGLARQVARMATERGMKLGAFSGSAALGTGEVTGEFLEAGLEVNPFLSLGTGGVIGALELTPYVQLARVLRPDLGDAAASGLREMVDQFNLPGRIGITALGIGASEAVTETLQEIAVLAARDFADENFEALGPENYERIMEAAAAGALVGGIFGGIGGAFTSSRKDQIIDPNGEGDLGTQPSPPVVPPNQQLVIYEPPVTAPNIDMTLATDAQLAPAGQAALENARARQAATEQRIAEGPVQVELAPIPAEAGAFQDQTAQEREQEIATGAIITQLEGLTTPDLAALVGPHLPADTEAFQGGLINREELLDLLTPEQVSLIGQDIEARGETAPARPEGPDRIAPTGIDADVGFNLTLSDGSLAYEVNVRDTTGQHPGVAGGFGNSDVVTYLIPRASVTSEKEAEQIAIQWAINDGVIDSRPASVQGLAGRARAFGIRMGAQEIEDRQLMDESWEPSNEYIQTALARDVRGLDFESLKPANRANLAPDTIDALNASFQTVGVSTNNLDNSGVLARYLWRQRTEILGGRLDKPWSEVLDQFADIPGLFRPANQIDLPVARRYERIIKMSKQAALIRVASGTAVEKSMVSEALRNLGIRHDDQNVTGFELRRELRAITPPLELMDIAGEGDYNVDLLGPGAYTQELIKNAKTWVFLHPRSNWAGGHFPVPGYFGHVRWSELGGRAYILEVQDDYSQSRGGNQGQRGTFVRNIADTQKNLETVRLNIPIREREVSEMEARPIWERDPEGAIRFDESGFPLMNAEGMEGAAQTRNLFYPPVAHAEATARVKEDYRKVEQYEIKLKMYSDMLDKLNTEYPFSSHQAQLNMKTLWLTQEAMAHFKKLGYDEVVMLNPTSHALMQIWADQNGSLARGRSREINAAEQGRHPGTIPEALDAIAASMRSGVARELEEGSIEAQKHVKDLYGVSPEEEAARSKLLKSYTDRMKDELYGYAEIAIYGTVKTERLPSLGKFKKSWPAAMMRMASLLKLNEKTREVKQILVHWNQAKLRDPPASPRFDQDTAQYVNAQGRPFTPNFAHGGFDNLKTFLPLYNRYKTLWNQYAGSKTKHEHEVFAMGKEPGTGVQTRTEAETTELNALLDRRQNQDPLRGDEVARLEALGDLAGFRPNFPDMQVAVIKLPEAPDFLEVGVHSIEGNPTSPLGARWNYVQDEAVRVIDAALGDHC